ncbi:hypothetical protein BDQ17DRAFT_1421485 [Cyathus striatus]|nr:hypothetical protein BDQ17DRAFT_1421485 [Cyathus striatus]
MSKELALTLTKLGQPAYVVFVNVTIGSSLRMRMRSIKSLFASNLTYSLGLQTRSSISTFPVLKKMTTVKGLHAELLYEAPLPTLDLSSNTTLQQHIQKGQFAAAERLLDHLTFDGIPISPHPMYEKAALDALKLDHKDDLEPFVTWLSLYPERGHSLCPSEDREILKATRIACLKEAIQEIWKRL